jgi:glycosyltransferase involved in cell wall biosynthesis
VETTFTRVWSAAATGTPAAELPAYRLQPPVADQLAGFLPQLTHWRWVDPPRTPASTPIPIDLPKEPLVSTSLTAAPPGAIASGLRPLRVDAPREDAVPDLVVLSHLRWTFVWQRPQHLVSRFARRRAEQGARTFFVEEPVTGHVPAPEVQSETRGDVIRVWLVVPGPAADEVREFDRRLDFDDPAASSYPTLLRAFLDEQGVTAPPEVLVYTPMALELAEALEPARLAYDVMDDLASFKNAPKSMVLRQRRLLGEADVVFAGGRSLHRSASAQRKRPVHLFPSGVDIAHYASAVALRNPRPRPVAGYVGVIDERLDLDLLAGLAAELSDWELRIVGPVAKIEPEDLPSAPNLVYPGKAAYEDLPQVMAGFDVALMPFALNEATRSISPTKTLEYLAAGLPVVSTRVPDVVADYTGTVHLADDAAQFAAGCRKVIDDSRAEREQRIRHIKHRQEWDTIAAAIDELIHPSSSSVTTQGATA